MSEKEEGAVTSKRKHKQWINQASVLLSSCHLAFISKGQVCYLMWFFHGRWPAGWWQLQKCLLLARLVPSQHSWTTTQDYLTETRLRQSRYEPQSVTCSDSPSKHPGSGQLATPCWGQQSSSPASYRERGCLVTIFLWEMLLKAEHWHIHAGSWSQAAPPHETLSCGVVSTVHSAELWNTLSGAKMPVF